MNKNVAVFILLSIGFGLGAVFLAKNWLDKNQPTDLKAGQAMVVSVTTTLLTGTVIEAKHVTLTTVPKTMVPQGAITDLEQATGMVVKQKLFSGDILRAERVAKKGEGSSLASLIGSNKRAVSIRVDDVVGVSGFILPGNKIDVLTTYTRDKKVLTEVILSNIKILAVDQRASNDENKPQIVRAVTLEVDLTQAELLMSAQRKGTLQLALRNPNDESDSLDLAELTEVEVIEPFKPIVVNSNEQDGKPMVIDRNRRGKVEIIRGVEKETVQVSNE